MTLAGNTATYPPYETVTPSANLSHFIVLFTFTLTDDSLIDGDVLQFLIKTDYGDSSSGFFLNAISNSTWNKNAQPVDTVAINSPSIWLQDTNNNLISGAIESAQVTNTSLNTNTNDYRQTLSVTINTSSNISGTVILGIFDQSYDYLASHPSTTYDVDYQISANCWTSTGLKDGYSFDPCSGRSGGSLTNSSLEATGFGQETPIVEGGDYVRLCSIEFTATNAGLIGGDILILKLITSYTGQYNTVDGFFTDNPSTPSFVTLNANGYNTNNAYVAMWISQGTTGLTPVSNMINSLSTTFSTTGSGATQKYIQTISITLSGTSTTTYGSAGTTWKINISGAGSSTTDITQIPTTAGTIDYQLDLNCFTGTGEQSGTSWLANPCFGRGGDLDFPSNSAASHYPNSLDGGVDLEYLNLPFKITPDISLTSKILTGDVIVLKIYTTPSTFSFFDSSYSGSSSIALNTGGYPGLTLQTIDTTTNPATYTTVVL